MNKTRALFLLTALYAVCVFVTSDDSTLRVMSMTACNFVSLAMGIYLLVEAGSKRAIVRARDPLLGWGLLACMWAPLTVVISRFNSATAIPREANSFQWTHGMNAPDWRGFAFSARLALSVIALHFIYRAACDARTHAKLVKVFSWAYAAFCTAVLVQIISYRIFGVAMGQIFFDDSGGFRIGSYVGEPSVLAGILASGYFLVFPWNDFPREWPRLPAPTRWYTFVAATIGIVYTLSASVITGLAVAILFTSAGRRKKLATISVIAVFLAALKPIYSLTFDNAIVAKIAAELTTVNIRSLSWIIGWRMWLASPITGVGIGQSPFFNSQFMPRNIYIPFDIGTYYNYAVMRYPPMNTYLELLSETGAIGFLIVAAGAQSVYRYQRARNAPSTRAVRATFGMSLVTLLVSANSFPDAFYLAHLIFVLAMYLGGLHAYSMTQMPLPQAADSAPTTARGLA